MFGLQIAILIVAFINAIHASPIGPLSGNLSASTPHISLSETRLSVKRVEPAVPTSAGSITSINALSVLELACSSIGASCVDQMTFSESSLTASLTTTATINGSANTLGTAPATSVPDSKS